jgi:lipid II:glycine glycyltransferase (peptidoglycan interpeptide bridge formation enzyme)
VTSDALTRKGVTNPLAPPDQAWDHHLCRLGGHLLQSWRWGEFKARHGWSVTRVAVGAPEPQAMAQVLFRHVGPFSVAYIPRGPAFAPGAAGALRDLFGEIDRICRERRAIHLIVEPDQPLPFTGTYKSEGFVRGPDHFQPGRTVKVPLLEDEALLAQMHQKTRYSVRLAQRRGVGVIRAEGTADDAKTFYQLLQETAERNQFGIHEEAYYRDFLHLFRDDRILLFAEVDGVLGAGLIAARFGKEAIYMYGASSTHHRGHGAAFLLQFEAMRWARAAGCERYDLWGIPSRDPETTASNGDRVPGTHGDDWRGLYKFKVGFGGEIVTYPPTLERRYRPFLSFVARRRLGHRG